MDFQIKGKQLMSRQPDLDYYSFKFKASDIQYLIAFLLQTSDIVFLADFYLPGQYNYLDILKDCGILDK